MTDEAKLLKKRTQNAIQSAMKQFRGGPDYLPPQNVIHSDRYRQLSRFQIDQGVIALALQLNLSGGSIGDMDLYRLVRTYLWDEEARKGINEIVGKRNLY